MRLGVLSGGVLRPSLPRPRLVVAIAAAGLLVLIAGVVAWSAVTNRTSPIGVSADDLLHAGVRAQLAGRNTEAAVDYHRVLAINPNEVYAYYNLGLIDQQAGQAVSAELNYRRALAVDPKFVPALYNLAIIRTSPAPKEAESLYRQVIALQPNHAAAHLNLGFLLIQEGSPAAGRTELDRAIALDPSLKSRLPASSPSR